MDDDICTRDFLEFTSKMNDQQWVRVTSTSISFRIASPALATVVTNSLPHKPRPSLMDTAVTARWKRVKKCYLFHLYVWLRINRYTTLHWQWYCSFHWSTSDDAISSFTGLIYPIDPKGPNSQCLHTALWKEVDESDTPPGWYKSITGWHYSQS